MNFLTGCELEKSKLSRYSISLFIMKLLTTLILVGLTTLNAKTIYSQNKLDLNIQNGSLKELFEQIEAKSNYIFFYKDGTVLEDKDVTLKVQGKDLKSVLDHVLKQRNLAYHVEDRQVSIYPNTTTYSPSIQTNITGTIKDEAGVPLSGAAVVEKGTENGTMADFDGNFALTVANPNAVLVVSFIGYASQEIPVNGQSTIDIILKEDTAALEEVVVVGYGTQKKYSVISSVSTVQPEELQTSSSRSISNNLAGRLAGVIAVQRSGELGYDNSQFWIRGISSFAGNSAPLVLVDGVERSLNNIDPAEIATFSILKDASASAVYGVRGANGVILITTKRGKVSKPRVNFRYERSITQPIHLPEFIGAAEYLEVFNSIARRRRYYRAIFSGTY